MTTALPPHILHSSTQVSPAAALDTLSSFLSAANDTAALRPDSTLSTRGPISSGGASGNANLILHHLDRIKQGLEGTRIGAAELAAEDAVAESRADQEREASRKRRREEGGGGDRERGRGGRAQVLLAGDGGERVPNVSVVTPEGKTGGEDGDDWEDKDDYELAQAEDEVDMNAQRDPAGDIGADEAHADVNLDMIEVEETQPDNAAPAVDKEERKRLKKLKQKQEKRTAEKVGTARGKKDKKASKGSTKT